LQLNLIIHRLDDTLHVAKDEPKQYPRKISLNWKKVSRINIDTAIQINGITYFFDGKMFYEFDDKRMQLGSKPHLSAQRWMNCDFSKDEVEDIEKSYFERQMANNAIGESVYSVIILFILVVFIGLL
jgi:Hemopexin